MSFKDTSWNSRFEKLGDEAEGIFEQVCDKGFVRYGLNRPPLQMRQLPARIRYTPDYLMSGQLVEVQGFGRDNLFKLKLEKWQSLHWWNAVHPVQFFVWDSHCKIWCYVTLDAFDDLVAEHGSIERFPEGKTYIAVKGEALFAASFESGPYANPRVT